MRAQCLRSLTIRVLSAVETQCVTDLSNTAPSLPAPNRPPRGKRAIRLGGKTFCHCALNRGGLLLICIAFSTALVHNDLTRFTTSEPPGSQEGIFPQCCDTIKQRRTGVTALGQRVTTCLPDSSDFTSLPDPRPGSRVRPQLKPGN